MTEDQIKYHEPFKTEEFSALAEHVYEVLLNDTRIHNEMTDYAFQVLGLKSDVHMTDELIDKVTYHQIRFIKRLVVETLGQIVGF